MMKKESLLAYWIESADRKFHTVEITVFNSVKKYIDFLKKNDFDIRRAYLFGSHARGNPTENSDIDIAVVMGNLSNGYLMQVRLMKIGRKFDTRIEPHAFDESDFDNSNPFAHEILTTGVQVF